MSAPTQPICVIGCMIVKNEEPVIKQTLDNFADAVDYWIISDTGSTDNTIAIAEEWLQSRATESRVQHMDKPHVQHMDKPRVQRATESHIQHMDNSYPYQLDNGEIHINEWVDFSTNRNIVAKLAKQYQYANPALTCYTLSIDACDDCEGDLHPILMEQQPRLINITVKVIDVRRSMFVSNDPVARCFKTSLYPRIHWKASIHEYLHAPTFMHPPYNCDSTIFKIIHDYSKDTPSESRYKSDLKLLKQELADAIKNDNYTMRSHAFYYLAQTYALVKNEQKAVSYLNKWLKYAKADNIPILILQILCLRVLYTRFQNQQYINCVYGCAQAYKYNINDLNELRKMATYHFYINMETDKDIAFETLSRVVVSREEIIDIYRTYIETRPRKPATE